MTEKSTSKKKNGRLKIELGVEDALRAALQTAPPLEPKKTTRKRKRRDPG